MPTPIHPLAEVLAHPAEKLIPSPKPSHLHEGQKDQQGQKHPDLQKDPVEEKKIAQVNTAGYRNISPSEWEASTYPPATTSPPIFFTH